MVRSARGARVGQCDEVRKFFFHAQSLQGSIWVAFLRSVARVLFSTLILLTVVAGGFGGFSSFCEAV